MQMDDNGDDLEIERNLFIIQSMIDVSAERLEGLRTQCSISAELTQQEIRTLEGKLIKLFSEQLVTRSKLRCRQKGRIPALRQWLTVVGLSPAAVDGVLVKIHTIEQLQDCPDNELRLILGQVGACAELSRLSRALHNLKRYTDILQKSQVNEVTNTVAPSLYWDSWDDKLPSRGRHSVPSEQYLVRSTTELRMSPSVDRLTEAPSTGHIHNNNHCTSSSSGGKGYPTTPPPRRKHYVSRTPTKKLSAAPPTYPLTKSKSHETNLVMVVMDEGEGTLKSPPPTVISSTTTTDSDDSSYKSAPCPTVMIHNINHRFTKTFKMMSTCGYCSKPIYFGTGLKCKECKYTCHRDCEDKVAPSCGLPPELLDEFKKKFSFDAGACSTSTVATPSVRSGTSTTTKNLINSLTYHHHRTNHRKRTINISPFPPPDSSSNTSSCNSSAPSSPAVVQLLQTPSSHHLRQEFHFPDVSAPITLETHPLQPQTSNSSVIVEHATISAQRSRDSDVTTVSGSTDSDRTPVGRVSSQDSQILSDSDTISSDAGGQHRLWPRQNSLSLREWDIPFEELKMGEVIGTGRFGTVYRGYWHGDVAVKVLNVNYLDDENTLEQFKIEVSTFRKTRHENLVLFMGACMQPPKLAIVTSLSKGMTLYTHIHLRRDKFNMNKTTIVAQQIAQGMGYLHAKGIIHKDLKTKNIFLDNGKVVITDFGLFSVTKLCFGHGKIDGLGIPTGWLCYLSPEIVKSLHALQSQDAELPFTKASDVYAFGTVWYELLCGEWPFKGQPPESIIWQVGRGMKQPLANLQASRDVKDILMLCWSFRPNDRPDFIDLLNMLEKLPKKRLSRSPSHPIHLSRSAESVF